MEFNSGTIFFSVEDNGKKRKVQLYLHCSKGYQLFLWNGKISYYAHNDSEDMNGSFSEYNRRRFLNTLPLPIQLVR